MTEEQPFTVVVNDGDWIRVVSARTPIDAVGKGGEQWRAEHTDGLDLGLIRSVRAIRGDLKARLAEIERQPPDPEREAEWRRVSRFLWGTSDDQ